MLVTLTPGQVAKAVLSATSKGNPDTNVTLSGIVFASADPTVFTVAPDPAVPNGCIITGVGSGSALQAAISYSATVTEPDGVTTESLSGSDTVGCSLAVVAQPPADGLTLTLTGSSPVPPPVPSAFSSLLKKS